MQQSQKPLHDKETVTSNHKSTSVKTLMKPLEDAFIGLTKDIAYTLFILLIKTTCQ